MTEIASETFGAGATIAPVTRQLTGADIMAELKEEIRKVYGGAGGIKAFAAELGVNYFTYRNYIVGETKMSTDLLMDSLASLGVDPADFFTNLRKRISGE